MKRLTGTWKNSASFRASALLINRLSFRTSETTLLDPKMGMRSRSRRLRSSISAECRRPLQRT